MPRALRTGTDPLVLLLLLAAALLLLPAGPARAADNGSWSVFPTPPAGAQMPDRAYFFHQGAAGTTVRDSVTVHNSSDRELSFRIFATDAAWPVWFGIHTPDTGLLPKLPATVAYGTAFALGWLLHRRPERLDELARRWGAHLAAGVALTAGCLAIVGTTPDLTAPAAMPGGEELRTLYNVGYVSSNLRRDGKWRRIVVRVPDRDGVQIRHKLGYYAPPG